MLNAINRALDAIDVLSVKAGLTRPAEWAFVESGRAKKLYAGRVSRHEPQFRSHLGITPFAPSSRNIPHDLTRPLPISDNSVEIFQASDVFEHIDYGALPAILSEVYRVLVPGGLFRFSVPDYRNPLYLSRTVRSDDGALLFDPGGGGRLDGDQVVDGGHVWFPLIESVTTLFEESPFARSGRIEYLHYIDKNQCGVLRPIDYEKGFVLRTPDHDRRSALPLSIVVDAIKGSGGHG